jgi:hypothetical protein
MTKKETNRKRLILIDIFADVRYVKKFCLAMRKRLRNCVNEND